MRQIVQTEIQYNRPLGPFEDTDENLRYERAFATSGVSDECNVASFHQLWNRQPDDA
jgi:hypothetical protein